MYNDPGRCEHPPLPLMPPENTHARTGGDTGEVVHGWWSAGGAHLDGAVGRTYEMLVGSGVSAGKLQGTLAGVCEADGCTAGGRDERRHPHPTAELEHAVERPRPRERRAARCILGRAGAGIIVWCVLTCTVMRA